MYAVCGSFLLLMDYQQLALYSPISEVCFATAWKDGIHNSVKRELTKAVISKNSTKLLVYKYLTKHRLWCTFLLFFFKTNPL